MKDHAKNLIIDYDTLRFVFFCTTSVYAADKAPSETIIDLEDGSRLIISAVYESENDSSAKAATNTVTKSREVYREDPAGNLEWKYTLTATFSNGSASKSGNAAYGKGHYTKKALSIEIKNIDVDISLTCDVYGNVT